MVHAQWGGGRDVRSIEPTAPQSQPHFRGCRPTDRSLAVATSVIAVGDCLKIVGSGLDGCWLASGDTIVT
jgi:hypothetical protein